VNSYTVGNAFITGSDQRKLRRESDEKFAWLLKPVLRIRIGFNADPDQAFYLSPYLNPGSQTKADPDYDKPLPSENSGFDIKKYTVLYVGNMS
jgi:hypothetical protein